MRGTCRGYSLFDPPASAAAVASSVTVDCTLCEPSAVRPASVAGLPLKAAKAAPRPMRTVCLLVELPCAATPDETRYLLRQRPATGLLANIWEFPGTSQDPPADEPDSLALAAPLLASLHLPPATPLVPLGETFHQFSHISQDIYPFLCTLPEGFDAARCVGDRMRCASYITLRALTHATRADACRHRRCRRF